MGVEPLALVQGYYCGQISNWSNYSYDTGYYYPCACYETGPHNQGWVGQVQALDDAWMEAHRTALSRMLNEAANLGAHGVVGVKTDISHPTNENSCEVHLYGTAVVMANAAPPQQLWSTQVAGHKLAKLVEIGFVPGSVAYSRCTAVMAEGCYMEYYGSGRCGTGYVISPLEDAHKLARSRALSKVPSGCPRTARCTTYAWRWLKQSAIATPTSCARCSAPSCAGRAPQCLSPRRYLQSAWPYERGRGAVGGRRAQRGKPG